MLRLVEYIGSMNTMEAEFMRRVIRQAGENAIAGRGGPFAAVVVKDGEIVAEGTNRVTSDNDPTAHAEVVAIRNACRNLDVFQLDDCDLYTSCEPCPMCLGAIYWARPRRVFYAATQQDAAEAGFDDAFIYEEIARDPSERRIPMERVLPEEATKPFDTWRELQDRIEY